MKVLKKESKRKASEGWSEVGPEFGLHMEDGQVWMTDSRTLGWMRDNNVEWL